MFFLTLAQTAQQVGNSVVSFFLIIFLLIVLLAIFSGYIKWVIGTSTIISQQKKIIELLERISSTASDELG